MLELTSKECLELEKRVAEKLRSSSLNTDEKSSGLYETIGQLAARATIVTIREYERMKDTQKD